MIKTKKFILWIMAFLPLLAIIIMMAYLPDKIPLHYNGAGEVDRIGSKYELLVTPLILLLTIFLTEVVDFVLKKKKNTYSQNLKVLFAVQIIVCFMFGCLSFYSAYLAFNNTENMNDLKFDVFKLLGVIMSVSFIVIGNVLPKCKQNYIVGIRTAWTLKNEVVWHKTHRIGGIAIFIFGIVSTIFTLILSGIAGFIFTFAGLMIFTPAIIVYSYVIYKKEVVKMENNKKEML